jgi:oxaloacetate decarboxylase beta subunit
LLEHQASAPSGAAVFIIAPKDLPLMASIMLGNFLKMSGVVPRLTKASENEIANISTLFLGLAIGGTMAGPEFLKTQTLMVFAARPHLA